MGFLILSRYFEEAGNKALKGVVRTNIDEIGKKCEVDFLLSLYGSFHSSNSEKLSSTDFSPVLKIPRVVGFATGSLSNAVLSKWRQAIYGKKHYDQIKRKEIENLFDDVTLAVGSNYHMEST